MKVEQLPSISIPLTWFHYFYAADDRIHSAIVDLTIQSKIPLPDRRFATLVQFSFNANEQGFPDGAMGHRLNDLALEFEKLVNDPGNFFSRLLGWKRNTVQLVGSRTGNGERCYVFYGQFEIARICFNTLVEKHPDLTIKFVNLEDPQWNVYHTLHPGQALNPLILSKALLKDRAVTQGDDDSVERLIDHTLAFTDTAARNKFLSRIKDEGYRSSTFSCEKTDLPCRVQLTLNETPDELRMDMRIMALSTRAQEYGGVYDGWGAPIIPKK